MWDQRKEGSSSTKGTHWENGWRTAFNHYVLDFNQMKRTNVDTKMVRPFRLIWTPKVVVQEQETQEEPPLKMLKKEVVDHFDVKASPCPLQ